MGTDAGDCLGAGDCVCLGAGACCGCCGCFGVWPLGDGVGLWLRIGSSACSRCTANTASNSSKADITEPCVDKDLDLDLDLIRNADGYMSCSSFCTSLVNLFTPTGVFGAASAPVCLVGTGATTLPRAEGIDDGEGDNGVGDNATGFGACVVGLETDFLDGFCLPGGAALPFVICTPCYILLYLTQKHYKDAYTFQPGC